MSLPAIEQKLREAKQKHPNAICWGCCEHKNEFLPYPCGLHKRWQSEGFCTDLCINGRASKGGK
jgi:hypothetical protein